MPKRKISEVDKAISTLVIQKEVRPLPIRNPVTQELFFKDYPRFTPNLTPKQVLHLGSFGGTYFRTITSSVTQETYNNAWKEFPQEWFEGLDVHKYVSSSFYDVKINKYKKKCGNDLDLWERSGWITAYDPYGWFQWYCRFYMGRRCNDDERQIARGLGVFGPKGRWKRNLVNKCVKAGDASASLEDFTISPTIRQLLQHWGYAITADDLVVQ